MAEIRRWNPRQAFEQMKERIEELEEVCTNYNANYWIKRD